MMMKNCAMEIPSSPVIKRRSCSSSINEENPIDSQKRRRLIAQTTTTDAAASPEQLLSGWSDLPKDIIGSILSRLTLLSDYDRFGAVCVSWRRASLEIDNRTQRFESRILDGVPLLLLPSDRLVTEDEKETSGMYKTDGNPWKRTLLDVFHQKILTQDFNLPPSLPKSVGRCCGSSHGWLIFADRYQNLALVNPFTIGGGPSCGGGIIRLPCVASDWEKVDDVDSYLESDEASALYIPELGVRKVVLSADPALFPNDYVVVAMCNTFSFIRPGHGDKHWTRVVIKGRPYRQVQDFLFRGNTIFAVVEGGTVYSCKITDPKPKLRKFAPPPPIPTGGPTPRCYLVEEEEGGEILLVYRLLVMAGVFFPTTGFRVFRLLAPGGGRLTAWYEMKKLGSNKALFLGENRSICIDISSSTCHDLLLGGFEQNSIYFTDDQIVNQGTLDPFVPYEDMGIFNLGDRTIKRYYDLNQLHELVCIPPPIWFFPSLPGSWKQTSPPSTTTTNACW